MGDTIKQNHHWDRHTLAFIADQITRRPDLVRIATGFFSVPGYHRLRRRIGETNAHILVGFDEDARESLTNALIEEILEEVRGWHTNRYEAIKDLAAALGSRLRLTEARMRIRDHAKVYILGEEAAIVGSSNLSRGGLLTNYEANTVLREPAAIRFWTAAFDERWHAPDTIDITEELRARLLAWLQLSTPWEVYLRAAFLLLDGPPPLKPSARYRQPTEYQQVVVNRISKQLADPERRGAFLIASTGLGKTIMATAAAAELDRLGVVNQVLVFAPRLVKEEWSQRLRSARLSAEVFTIDVLARSSGVSAAKIEDALANSDSKTLIIIDESHRLRNRLALSDSRTGPLLRLASQRIEETVKSTGSRVLLLTATPYAAEISDITNQMSLLPHTGKEPNVSGMLSLFPSYPWSVGKVEDLIESPVATILNTPFVAKHFARVDDESGAQFVDFPDGTKRFFPRLKLFRANVELPCEANIADLLNRHVLKHRLVSTPIRHEWRKRDNLAESNVATAWASSPRDLARTLREIVNGQHDYSMILSPEQLADAIGPVLAELENFTYEADRKFQILRSVIKHARKHGQKLVVYSERLETAVYLEQGLAKYGAERVASVVENAEAGAQLKPSKDVEKLIDHFAPLSSTEPGGTSPDDLYDVLLATDALSEGINLQAVSYTHL